MIQVASFLLPAEQDQANEFLKTHKPTDGGINFNRDTIIIFWDDGTYPPDDEIADLHELYVGNRRARLQHEVMHHVLKAELADLTPRHNKGAYEQKDHEVRQVEAAISNQDIKAEFLKN